jgi:hypothetical protein
MEKLWDSNISPTTLLVDTVTTPMLQKVVRSGKLRPSKLVTHRFAMNDTGEVLQVWKHGKRGRAQGGSHEMAGLVNSPRRLSRTSDREVPHPRNQQIKWESVSM